MMPHKKIDDYVNFFQEEVYNKEIVSLPEDGPFFTNIQHLFEMGSKEINYTFEFGSQIIKQMIEMNLHVNISIEENDKFLFLIFRQIDLEDFFDIVRFSEVNGQSFYLSYKYDGCYYGISISKISYEVSEDLAQDKNMASLSHISIDELCKSVDYKNIQRLIDTLEIITNDLSHIEYASLETTKETLHDIHDNIFEVYSILKFLRHFDYLANLYLDFANFLEDLEFEKLINDSKRSKFIDQLNEIYEDLENWVDTIFYKKSVEDINYHNGAFKKSFIKIKSNI